jgi:hypothetical protein
MPASFQRAIPYLTASLAYHNEFLRSSLSDCHPLWAQKIYLAQFTDGRSVFTFIKENLLIGTGKCEESGMQATGIPTNLAMVNRIMLLEKLIASTVDQSEKFKSDIMNYVHLESEGIKSLIETIPAKVHELVGKSFTGIVPMTRYDLERALTEQLGSTEARLNQRFEDMISGMTGTFQSQLSTGTVDPTRDPQLSDITPRYYEWGGSMGRLVPEGYRLPHLNIKLMWGLWYFGQKLADSRTYPFRKLDSASARSFKGDFSYNGSSYELSKYIFLMKTLAKIAVDLKLVAVASDLNSLTRIESDLIFDRIYKVLIEAIYVNGEMRPGEGTLRTIAEKASSKRHLLENLRESNV